MNPPVFRSTLVVAISALGLLLALAFNSARGVGDARPERVTDLAGLAREMEVQREDLQGRLVDLRARMNDFEREAAAAAGVKESFSRELAAARAAAGLTKVAGPGIEVMLSDSVEAVPGADPNDYLVHDTDVAAVVLVTFKNQFGLQTSVTRATWLGIALGLLTDVQIPAGSLTYVGVAVLAAFDSCFGGIRTSLEETFDDKVFVFGFLTNVMLAAFIVFLGDRIGVRELYLAAVVAFGIRLFDTLAAVRRIVFQRQGWE